MWAVHGLQLPSASTNFPSPILLIPVLNILIAAVWLYVMKYNPDIFIHLCQSFLFCPTEILCEQIHCKLLCITCFIFPTPITSSVVSIVSGRLVLDANMQLCNNLCEQAIYWLCIPAQQGAKLLKHSDASIIQIVNSKKAGLATCSLRDL